MTDLAIILAGGKGTRLGALTERTPKPLLPVAGRPFIFHILDRLINQGIKRIVLSTGYLGEAFEKVVGNTYCSLHIDHIRESEPLGTGGALALAFERFEIPQAFALNGDTLFCADLQALEIIHKRNRASLSIALRFLPSVSRYGAIETQGDRVTALKEKLRDGSGWISGGLYLIDGKSLKEDSPAFCFSFETTLIPKWIQAGQVVGFRSNGYFIDIGIPADLSRANIDLA